MSTEQPDREAGDEKLTAAYRSLSNERAPEGLNEQVLRQASRALRSPYAPPIRWSRPLAWAAVIVITFTILLQVRDLPTPETGEAPLSEAADYESAPARAVDDAPAERPELTAEPPARLPAEARRDALVQAAPPGPETAPPPGAPEPGAATEPRNRAAFTIQSTEPPERAGPTPSARVTGEAGQSLPQAAGLADRAAILESSAECSNVEQADPDSWYACIERLRDAGLDTAADEQLEALRAAFPDFEPPH